MKRQAGFTLIEIIVTIILLGIMAVTVGIFSMAQMQGVARSQEETAAFNLARLELETINNLAFTSITSLTSNNYKSYGYNVIRTVSYVFGSDASAESLKQVVIEVRKGGSSENLAKVTTYIARNATFGL